MMTTCPSDVAQALLRLAESQHGKRDASGWLGILCPYAHEHDKPGAHCWLSPEGNVAFCNGKHGTITWRDLASRWGVAIPALPTRRYEPTQPIKLQVSDCPPDYPLFSLDWVMALQANDYALSYLASRDISPELACEHCLGYTACDPRLPEWAWKKLAIPWIYDEMIVAVKLRRLGPKVAGQLTYVSLPNSNFSYLYNCIPSDCPYAVILETELDAIHLSHWLGFDGAAVATPAGSISPRNPQKLLGLAGRAVYRLGDNDNAGQEMNKAIASIRPDSIELQLPDGFKDYGDLVAMRDSRLLTDLFRGIKRKR